MRKNGLREAASTLLEEAGLGSVVELRRTPGGANNRVYRLKSGKDRFCLKVYFQHPDDPRERLEAEYSFMQFAWNMGIRALPEPITCDSKNNLALYEYLPGRRLKPGEVTPQHVDLAIDFYHSLNRHRESAEAKALPFASEACFSLSDHFSLVNSRVRRLLQMEALSGLHRGALDFVRGELSVCWNKLKDKTLRFAGKIGFDPDEPLGHNNRCISPSDFGFHNAIKSPSGVLKFIDFEYAGWDDPAKLVCDFFCQPEVPVPEEHLAFFAEAITDGLRNRQTMLARTGILLPVFKIKWCCILLNDFLPADSERRHWSGSESSREERLVSQLEKARFLLNHFRRRRGTGVKSPVSTEIKRSYYAGKT